MRKARSSSATGSRGRPVRRLRLPGGTARAAPPASQTRSSRRPCVRLVFVSRRSEIRQAPPPPPRQEVRRPRVAVVCPVRAETQGSGKGAWEVAGPPVSAAGLVSPALGPAAFQRCRGTRRFPARAQLLAASSSFLLHFTKRETGSDRTINLPTAAALRRERGVVLSLRTAGQCLRTSLVVPARWGLLLGPSVGAADAAQHQQHVDRCSMVLK